MNTDDTIEPSGANIEIDSVSSMDEIEIDELPDDISDEDFDDDDFGKS